MPSSTISATSKLPSGSGLAMTRMPGWVVPGPFGNFALVGVVVRDVGVVVGDGEPEGAWVRLNSGLSVEGWSACNSGC